MSNLKEVKTTFVLYFMLLILTYILFETLKVLNLPKVQNLCGCGTQKKFNTILKDIKNYKANFYDFSI